MIVCRVCPKESKDTQLKNSPLTDSYASGGFLGTPFLLLVHMDAGQKYAGMNTYAYMCAVVCFCDRKQSEGLH